MSKIWAESWTRPGHATFGRVHDFIPYTNAGLSDGLNKIGGGNYTLPDSWEFFDDLLLTDPITPLNSKSSLQRYYSEADPTRPFFEWLPAELIPSDSKEDFNVEVSGVGIKGILAYARVEAFDWDGTDDFHPADPDWLYGGNNTVRNPGFEDAPFAIPNQGFEDGTLAPWWAGAVAGVSANAVVQTAIVDTGTYAAAVTPLLAEGGLSTTFPVRPANFYTVTARFRGASGVDYQVGASGPEAIVPVFGNSVKLAGEFGPGGFEVQHQFVGTGAFQTVTLQFGSAGNQTSTQLSIREGEAVLNGATFYIDTVTPAGFGIGTDPWEPTGVNTPEVPGPVTVFEVSTVSPSAGTWSLFMTAAPGHGAFQELTGIKAGVTYTVSVDVGPADASSVWALEIRDEQGTVLGQDAATIGTGIGTFTTLTTTFQASDFIPGSQGSVFMRVINYSAAVRSVFVDEGVFFQGQPPDTTGKILGDLYDDATLDHNLPSMPIPRLVWADEANVGFPYLLKDFSDTLDSAGAAWVDPAISIRLTMRMSYSQVMAEFARMGYEYRIVPDLVLPGIWLWQVYNPGTMMTDYTALAGPAIQGGSSDVSRSLVRQRPPSTEQLVEGLDRVTARDRDANLVTALGRIEGNILDREVPDLVAAIDRVEEAVATTLTASKTYSYSLSGTLQEEPLTAYQLGDLLNIIDPPEVPLASSRFVNLVVSITPLSVRWDVQFGSAVIIGVEAATVDAVAILKAKFEYPEVRPSSDTAVAPPAGEGGMMTVAVAAVNASPMSQGKADFICDGTDDHEEIIAAIQICYDAGGGTVWLSEGDFSIDPDLVIVGGSISSPEPMTLRGMGRDSTRLVVTNHTVFGVYVAVDCELRDLECVGPGGV